MSNGARGDSSEPPSTSPGPPPRVRTPTRGARVRWGIGDFFWVLAAQIGGVVVGVVILAVVSAFRDVPTEVAFFLVLLPMQSLAMVTALVIVSRKKGVGSLRVDFGLTVSIRARTALLAGLGWRFAIGILLFPFLVFLDADEPVQQIVEDIREVQATVVWVAIILSVVVVQPVVEEVLFRGLLLRALLRRTSPFWAVVVSGVAFGLIHLLGVEPGPGAVVTVVGLTAFGMGLAVQTLRHGSLSRPILTHAMFNCAAVVGLLLVEIG